MVGMGSSLLACTAMSTSEAPALYPSPSSPQPAVGSATPMLSATAGQFTKQAGGTNFPWANAMCVNILGTRCLAVSSAQEIHLFGGSFCY